MFASEDGFVVLFRLGIKQETQTQAPPQRYSLSHRSWNCLDKIRGYDGFVTDLNMQTSSISSSIITKKLPTVYKIQSSKVPAASPRPSVKSATPTAPTVHTATTAPAAAATAPPGPALNLCQAFQVHVSRK